MARDSSGVYTLPLPPVEADEIISASWCNTTLADIAQALTESVPTDGSAPITGQTKIADGSNAAPGLAFNAESSTGFRRPEANTIAVIIGGIEKLRVKGGNLIVGSTTDSGERLQVSGNTKLTGNLHATGTLTIDGTSVQHGDIDARGNVGADGYVQGVLGVLSDGNIVSSAGNVVAGGNVYATLNLMGQRVLVNAGTLAEPSINFNGYGAGFYFPTSGEVEAVGDGVSVAKFGVNKTEVNDALIVRGTGADNAIVEIGKDRATSASAILRMRSTGTGAANPVYDFAMSRTSGDNGVMYYLQQGTGRMQFQSGSSEYRYTTTANTVSTNYVAATTSADNGVYGTAVSSSGQVSLILRNAAQTQSLLPYYITRSATGGILAQIWKVGGDITTGLGSLETFRITDNNRFLVGNAADAIWSDNATDASTNYYFHGAKLGGGSSTISMGSEASFDANLAFSRNNTSTKRVIFGQVVGNMSSSTAGAEAGQLYLRTKDAADAATVTRMTINGSGATYTVPVVAPVGTEAAPTHTFAGDTDTGMYRSATNQLDFSTGGVRRLNIDASGRLYAYSTGGDLLNLNSTVNNGLMQITATTGTANINNLAWYLTSSGSAILLLRNDAKTAYVSPITVQRNATSGTSNVSFRVGGDANVNGSDLEAGRFVVSTDGAQGRLLVGHTAQDIFFNNADAAGTNNFQIYSYKTGANGPVSLLGTDGVNTSLWSAARTNTASRRVVHSTIGGVSVSSTAGAERGRIELSTKAAADAGVVVRATIDETTAAFSVPITAPNLSYSTKVVSASLVNDGITSTAAGFTLNTSDCAAGRVFQIYNNSAASITITQGAGLTMRLVGTATTGNRTIAQRGLATFTCISGTEVVVEGAT